MAKESGRSGGRAQSVENREHWQYDLICNKPKRGGSMRRLLLLALLAMLLLASAQAKEVALAALQGNAWHDLDYDGLQDPGEPGLANVQVVLLDGSGNPLTPVQIGGLPVATQTDADGAYQFTVPSGRQYRVKYSPSSGLFFSPKDQGSDDTKDSDADPATGQTDAIATIPGQSYPGWDAGIYENEIIINEIYPNPTGSDNRDGVISWERVELKNIGSSDCNIGQWSIEDDEGTLYTIPAGTTLPAGGYLVVHIGGYSVGISNSAGDPVILYNFARQEMERVVCPVCSKKEGLSYSCLPDASENWDFRGEPTFGGDLSETSLPGAVNAVQDYGDAPASTGTTRAQNGPRHFILGPHLGSLVDNEPDGQPGSNANGDDTTGQDDEDGVTFSDLIVGQSSTFDVTASASGILQAWMDFNGDGAFDNSAERIVTDQSLTAGEHSLSFSVPSGAEVGFTYARFRLSSSSGLSPLGPAADGEVEDYQVEIKQKYILGDRVWEDLNGDGLQDAAEPGVDSAVVNLRDEQNNLVASQTTSGGGYYEFINPLPGTYTLEFLPPQGYLFTQKDVGPDDEKDSDADPATHLAGPVTVVLDQSKSTWDAGLCHFASISGCKFEDKDGDGQRDSDEPGLKDWTITLCKPDESEITATTDENGFYSFTNLPPGSYNVNEVQQYGWIQTAPALESEGDTHYNVTLSGTNVTNKNFGNRGALSVCGSKIYDLNGNGLWDEGEPGLQGWEIQLKDGNGAIVQTITGTDGAYGFPNLEPTTYIVSEVQKNFWVQTALLESSYTLNLANGDFHDKNFTNRGTLSISGIKFSDINGNGVRDQNEPLLPDWQIQLRDNQDLLLKTVSTSNDTATLGAYTFTNLGPGVYKLTEISQNGWVQTAPPGGQHTVELVNANVEGKDFGNNRLAIYGYKFQDINGNGQKEENEPYLLGWEIKLKDGSGNEQTMTTSSEPGQEGRYSFSGLQPGAYKVSEVQKPGWVRTTPTEESYDVQLSTQAVGPVIFGNRGTLSISGMKFEDMNGNGQKDADETGLKDWTIRLQSPQIIETNTTTGQDGSYQFQNLPPGDYTISELLQSGWVQTAPPGGQHTVELVNANVEGKDFGNNRLAIYGYKFQDINDNGQKEENEPYLLGWEIKLKDGNGNEQTVTTSSEPGQEGRYSFSGLQPGAYKVSEVQKPGWVRTIPAEESYDVQLSTQAVGPVIFGNRGTLSISGMKFHDRNANSQKDEDELPLSDWEIQLRDGNGVVQTVKTSAKPGEEGGYEFVNLQPGTYTVTEEQRTGWVQTVPTEDGYSITLTNQPVRGKIFGNNMLAISGICFLDSNGNSQRDQDESPFSGWEIQLKDGSGNVLQTATTSFGPGSEGRYEFMNLAPGTYRVSESPRAGWIRTFPQDEDHVVTLTNKGADCIDFGNCGTLSVSGIKFQDRNANGQKDEDDSPLSDWEIQLRDGNGVVLNVKTSGKHGEEGGYEFVILPPGR
jgi:protocatechuate 3,4-dioxygenase beta subunit